ncbi:SCO3374 family protein [Streptomyces sp. NPDC001985]|uniref:SCO3374 family protein n=1 Tax=Streptomyces sp. NPDC001985 TaxID=3154406 RepID=UPI003330A4B8
MTSNPPAGAPAVPHLPRLPQPRSPADDAYGPWARWYEQTLGWAVADGAPPWLRTGLRFDVLEVPSAAGAAVLRRGVPTGPVAAAGGRMRLWVAAGSAEELPGLLDWLQWGGIALELTALGAGGRLAAPPPPGGTGSGGTAGWLRPPVPGREVEPTLPALAPFGRGTGAGRGSSPDLARLLDAVATECHRARLLRTAAPPHAETTTCTNPYEYAACEYSAD